MRPRSFRSSSVVNAIESSRTLMITIALIAPIHHGSLTADLLGLTQARSRHAAAQSVIPDPPGYSCTRHLHPGGEAARELVRDPGRAGDEPRVDPGAELDGRAVRAHADGLATGDAAHLRVLRREFDLRLRALELE